MKIKIKAGDLSEKEFIGDVDITSNIRYLFEKKNPFNPSLYYRHGKYIQDDISISFVCLGSDYLSVYKEALDSGEMKITWDNAGQTLTRNIEIETLTLPAGVEASQLFAFDLKLKSTSYQSTDENIVISPDEEYNYQWNISTISNTIWN